MLEGSLLISAKPRTNFSIDAIISNTKKEQIEETEEEEEIDIEGDDDNEGTRTKPEADKLKKKEKKPKVQEKCNCPELSRVHCTLDNKDLWDKFCEFGTEMIITRTGRRMFPTVRVSFGNLDAEPGVKYLVLLDIVPCDNKRYRYAYHRSAWLVAGKADPAPPHRIYPHPDGPFTPEQLNKQVVSFEKVKVTNNETDNTGQLILNSMHKFQPRVYLVRRREGAHSDPVRDIEREQYRSFVFPETQFTAVTAYQNQLITKLKIESNPFAKGFRDSSSQDGDDPYPSPYGFSSLPGGMPGLDPFAGFRPPGAPGSMQDNNNILEAAEKARIMMLYRTGGNAAAAAAAAAATVNNMQRMPPMSMASGGSSMPPLPPELLARYSAVQATLGMYNPSLLAAALRQANPGVVLPPQLLANHPPPPPLSPKPDLAPGKPARFSPYVIPTPHHIYLTAGRSPSGSPTRGSPPASDCSASPPPTSTPGATGLQQSSIEVD